MTTKSILLPRVIASIILITVLLVYLSKGPSTDSSEGASNAPADLDSSPKKPIKLDEKTVKRKNSFLFRFLMAPKW